ncbi:MAG TPA: YceI family protein [Bosea sp. (in: a-proteobacteria)]|uniref:YceI family protein n=1 Tax=Bosea sp. (in: a-proteobacteria) TaxID=1871050 RepID=UPI002E1408B6|nr:YceI family protein [Bosea sp. (in: a-proteobacteria)]
MTRLAVSMLALLAAGAVVAQTSLSLRPGASEVGFVARRFGVPTASGQFQHYDGVVALDFARPERSRIRITIETASLHTGTSLVDDFIKGESMLDTAHHPVASFTSDSVTRTGDRSLTIQGRLTIRSVTHPVAATAVAEDDVGAAERNGRLQFRASAAFSRSAFGIGREVNVVDDQVEIAIKGRLGQ